MTGDGRSTLFIETRHPVPPLVLVDVEPVSKVSKLGSISGDFPLCTPSTSESEIISLNQVTSYPLNNTPTNFTILPSFQLRLSSPHSPYYLTTFHSVTPVPLPVSLLSRDPLSSRPPPPLPWFPRCPDPGPSSTRPLDLPRDPKDLFDDEARLEE